MRRRLVAVGRSERSIDIRILLAIIVCMVLLASCGTTRQNVRTVGSRPALTKREFIERYRQLEDPTPRDAKGKISLSTKGESRSIGIRWTMARDKGFALSIRPMGLLEVARMTITPRRIVLLDRTSKEAFVSEDPDELSELFKDLTGYKSSMLNGVLTNTPFSTQEVGADALEKMKMSIENGLYHFYQKKGKIEISHFFDADMNLVETGLTVGGKDIGRVTYRDFEREGVGYKSFPTGIDLLLLFTKTPTQLTINLDRSSQKRVESIDDSVPKGYRRLGLLSVIGKARKLLR